MASPFRFYDKRFPSYSPVTSLLKKEIAQHVPFSFVKSWLKKLKFYHFSFIEIIQDIFILLIKTYMIINESPLTCWRRCENRPAFSDSNFSLNHIFFLSADNENHEQHSRRKALQHADEVNVLWTFCSWRRSD